MKTNKKSFSRKHLMLTSWYSTKYKKEKQLIEGSDFVCLAFGQSKSSEPDGPSDNNAADRFVYRSDNRTSGTFKFCQWKNQSTANGSVRPSPEIKMARFARQRFHNFEKIAISRSARTRDSWFVIQQSHEGGRFPCVRFGQVVDAQYIS